MKPTVRIGPFLGAVLLLAYVTEPIWGWYWGRVVRKAK